MTFGESATLLRETCQANLFVESEQLNETAIFEIVYGIKAR